MMPWKKPSLQILKQEAWDTVDGWEILDITAQYLGPHHGELIQTEKNDHIVYRRIKNPLNDSNKLSYVFTKGENNWRIISPYPTDREYENEVQLDIDEHIQAFLKDRN